MSDKKVCFYHLLLQKSKTTGYVTTKRMSEVKGMSVSTSGVIWIYFLIGILFNLKEKYDLYRLHFDYKNCISNYKVASRLAIQQPKIMNETNIKKDEEKKVKNFEMNKRLKEIMLDSEEQ